MVQAQKVSDQLEHWLHADEPRTIGGLIDSFGSKSFAMLFVVLMALPALPLPTGAVSHVLEVVTMLLALEVCRVLGGESRVLSCQQIPMFTPA